MVKITGSKGSMWFRSHDAAWEFTSKIEAWAGFSSRQLLTREEAVDYHLAYCEGGATAVLTMEAARTARIHAEAMAELHRKTLAEADRQNRYAMASMMPKDSTEYRTHFDSWHPGYKWGA